MTVRFEFHMFNKGRGSRHTEKATWAYKQGEDNYKFPNLSNDMHFLNDIVINKDIN